MKLRTWFQTCIAALIIAIPSGLVIADYNATQGGATIFRAFDATHAGTALCAAANTQCAAFGLINSAGAEIATSGAPLRIDPTGTTTQPVSLTSVPSHAVTNAGTFAVQATQAGTWTMQPGNTANTTPWLFTINQGSASAVVKAGNTAATTDVALVVSDPNVLAAINGPIPTQAATVDIGATGISQTTVGTTNAVSLKYLNTTAIDANSGNKSGGTLRSVLATDQLALATWGHGTSGASVPTGIQLNGARAANAEQTAVTNGQGVGLVTDLVGKLITLPYANPENFVSGAITTAMTGTTTTSLVAAPAAGLRNYLTTIVCSNAHATVGTDIVIQDGSGGTTLMTIPAAAVYGGGVVPLPVPLRQPTTATAIFVANVTTGASTKCSAVGYKGT